MTLDQQRWQKVETLYNAALEREPLARATFLEEACAGDEELRREVEELLSHDGAAESFSKGNAPAFESSRLEPEELSQTGARLLPGQPIGAYKILSLLGRGGMGVVYRARDERLKRDVAIKVLPTSLADDADRLRRFEQEAHATSALNHPNILTIYDTGTHEGAPYIVAELLEGEELREQLNDGALPVRRALDYAQQIATGLAAAHAKGIVHRDLKPENLFVTNDGRVKILDFGLAKLKTQTLASGVGSDALTQMPLTNPGVIIGTIGYMSPEQVRGQEADHRSDIFSFGMILYEMLSGQRAFNGASVADVMSAILKEEPPELADTNSKISPALDKIVRRCLEKRPERRFQNAYDLGFALEALSTPSGSRLETTVLPAGAENVGASSVRKHERLVWLVAVFALLLGMLGFAWAYFTRQPMTNETRVMKLSLLPSEKVSFSGPFAVSPDGRRVVLLGTSEGKRQLWLQALDSLSAQPLAGTEDAIYSFWSPDSRFIGFFAGGKLKKIEATGGPAQTLCDAPQGARGATWNRDNVIVFAPSYTDALYRVTAAGAPVPLTTLDASRKETGHVAPQFLPDGRHFIYLAISAQRENSGISVGSLDSKETKLLVNTYQGAAYAPPGYLLFMKERTLLAQSFDADRLELKGETFPVAEQVNLPPGAEPRFALFSVSETGVLVYRSGSRRNYQLTWFDRSGKQLGTVGPPGGYANPSLSPDEKRVAVEHGEQLGQGGSSDIWLIETGPRGVTDRFTSDPAREVCPLWSSDGSRIVFSSDRDGPNDLYQRSVSGAGGDEALFKSDNRKVAYDWSKDGRFILYVETDPKTNDDLWVLPLTEGQKQFPFLRTEFSETHAQFSPDGKWIAYSSNDSGMWQVYVRSFPDRGGKWTVSTSGGVQPRWGRDGRELFYISADRKMMAVGVKTDGATFEAGVPKALFDLPLYGGLPGPRDWYTVSKDGQRFLVSRYLEGATTPTIVVLNWTAGVKK